MAILFLNFLNNIAFTAAATLTKVSDTLSTSRPNVLANHTIRFTTTATVPTAGKIILIPAAGSFSIPATLDYTDIDLLVNSSNRALASSPGMGAGSSIGVSVVSGTSGSITFTLNDTDTIAGGSAIIIKIGTVASFSESGDQRITNPSSAGSVRLHLKTQNSSGITLDEADAMVAIVSSVSVSASRAAAAVAPAPAPAPAPSGGGGGGGGGVVPSLPITSVTLSGRAYPLSAVTVLKDGQIALTTIAGPDANFKVVLTGLSAGQYIFAVFGEDDSGRRSALFTFPIFLTTGAATTISGIFISPTIAVDKSEIKRGDSLAIFGQSVSRGEITIAVNSDQEIFVKTRADKNGVYLYNFDTAPLNIGQHSAKSKAAVAGETSSYSKVVGFTVGTKSVARKKEQKAIKGDIQNDGRVNLIDFSILAYWYKRPKSPARVDLNGDGKVTLVDFSIMAYYWTG